MKTRSALALGFVLLGTATASAQAPGESYAQPPSETAPVVVAPAPHAIEPMRHRFAINLNVGGFSVAPEDAPEGSEANFNIAELNLRFRATRRLEVFLAFTGGRQTLENDMEGDLATDMVTLGLRFNFRPEHRWNWYLMAGFGSTLIAPHDTPKDLRDDLRRGHGMFGVGVERRWRQFALQAELRGVGVEARDDAYTIQPEIVGGGNGTTVDAMSNAELGGGQFTVGASFYF